MKAICNDGAGHGSPEANETDSESDANVEKENYDPASQRR
jgi:hypothetical protein